MTKPKKSKQNFMFVFDRKVIRSYQKTYNNNNKKKCAIKQ